MVVRKMDKEKYRFLRQTINLLSQAGRDKINAVELRIESDIKYPTIPSFHDASNLLF